MIEQQIQGEKVNTIPKNIPGIKAAWEGGGWASPSGTPGHLDKVWGRPGVGLGRQGGKRGSGGTYSRQAYMGVYGEPGPRVT